MLANASGFVVGSFHTVHWPAFLATLALGGLLGFRTGGLVGVHLPSTLATMLAFAGLFEGVYQRWRCCGWAGTVLGGPVGVLGVLVVWLIPMLLHLAVILCGIDPFANLDPPGDTGSRAP